MQRLASWRPSRDDDNEDRVTMYVNSLAAAKHDRHTKYSPHSPLHSAEQRQRYLCNLRCMEMTFVRKFACSFIRNRSAELRKQFNMTV